MGWKFMIKFCLLFITLIASKLYEVRAASCSIPRGEKYSRSIYRPQYGSNTNNYPAGKRVRSGTKIVIICRDDMYHDVATEFSTSRCSNRRWVPALPKCEVKKRCRAPPEIEHATASERISPYITFPHGTPMTYTCDVENMVAGSADTIVCEDGHWTNTDLQCTVKKRCQAPPEIGHATASEHIAPDITFPHGTPVTYTCDVENMVAGSADTIVCEDGHWTNTDLQCTVKKRCEAPPEIEHATASEHIAPDITFPHGTPVTYTCDIGKMAGGSDDTIICEDGQWTNTNFQCIVERRCQAPPEIQYATASERITPYLTFPHGTTLTYTCDIGNMAAGSDDTIVCEDGQWTVANFQCIVESDCAIPTGSQYRRSMYRPQTGPGTDNYPTGSLISSGTRIVAICKKDIYGDVITNWTISECQDREWLPALPDCKRKKRCRSPPEIQHATITETTTPHRTFRDGSALTYTCDVGKMATGSNTIVCNDGQWSDTEFHCEEYKKFTTPAKPEEACSQLLIKYGKIYLKDLSNGVYDVKCDVGFSLKPKRKAYMCRDGQWIGVEPRCTRDEKMTTTETVSSSTQKSREHTSTPSVTSFSQTSSEGTTTSVTSKRQDEQITTKKTATSSMRTSRVHPSTSLVTSSSQPTLSTTSPTPRVTTETQDIEYQIHLQVQDRLKLPTYLALSGTLGREVKLVLGTVKEGHGLIPYSVTAVNVGEIYTIIATSSSGSFDTNVKAVSIFNPDTNGFYVEKFNPLDPQEMDMRKSCKRQFGEDLDMHPKWQDYTAVGLFKVYVVRNDVDCKLRCVEEKKFNCTMTFYHVNYHRCYVLEKSDRDLYTAARNTEDIVLSERTDDCF